VPKAAIVTPNNTTPSLFDIIKKLIRWMRSVPGGLWPAIVAVFCAGVITFSAGLTTISPMDRDEARFAQASKQMVLSGDYVTPRFQDELRAKKPAGIYWLQSLSASVFGINDISSYRIPSVIGGLITIIAITVFTAYLLPAPMAVFAGLFMATSLLVVVESHLAKTDAMLAAIIVLQQITLWRIHSLAKDRHYVSGKLAALFWGLMGIAILIKGPIGPAIAAGTIGLIIAAYKQWRFDDKTGKRQWAWLTTFRPVLGMVVLTIVVLPWVVLVNSATDGDFLSIAIQDDLLSKLQSGQESHGAPPLTYLALIIITFWPASLLLARAAWAVWQKRNDDLVIFLLGWLVPFWIILELTPTKLPHYNLPVFAALAILTCYGIGVALPKKPAVKESALMRMHRGRLRLFLRKFSFIRLAILIWEWIFMATGPALGAMLYYATTLTGGSTTAATLALVFGSATSVAAFLWHRKSHAAALVAVLLLGGAMHVVTMGFILPSLEGIRLAPRIEAELAKIRPEPKVIAAAGYHEPSLVFLLGQDTLLFTPQDTAIFLAEGEDGIALVERRSETHFRSTLDELGIKVERLTSITGYNISRGQSVEINVYRRPRE
jgi:4-amino-4-deoxy-L-arabinose transferase-like glycosyltransferase